MVIGDMGSLFHPPIFYNPIHCVAMGFFFEAQNIVSIVLGIEMASFL
jgi:hypothetical protein